MARLLITDVTLIKTDHIQMHVRLRGGQNTSLKIPLPLNAWQARKTGPATLDLLNNLLDTHTDAEAAAQLNLAGHRTGENHPFTPATVKRLRHDYHLPGLKERLHAAGMLTLKEMADRLHVSTYTIKDWHQAGLITGRRANDKNEQLYHPPATSDPHLLSHRGNRLTHRSNA